MKTLYLAERVNPAVEGGKMYIVTKTVNTIRYNIGVQLTPEEVAAYCGQLTSWKIVVT